MSILTSSLKFLLYIFVPLVIRYVILQRPIYRKWVAAAILLPIFLVFVAFLNYYRLHNAPATLGSPLLSAAMIFSFLILYKKRNKAKPLSKSKIEKLRSSVGEDGYTELMYFCCTGDIDSALNQIKQGANVNSQALNGNTALMYAAAHGHINCVKLLLDNGATAALKNNDNLSACDYAEKICDDEIIKLLSSQESSEAK